MGDKAVRKYATAATIDGISLNTAGTADIRANPTLAAGDVKISKDAGSFANLATLPSAVPAAGKSIEVALSSGETTCARAVIDFIDQTSPKEWDDFRLIVETFGHASAQFPPDYSDSVRQGMTALPNAAAEAAGGLYTRGSGAGQITQDANGRIDVNLKAAAGTAVTLDANNVLNVSAKYWGGTLITATSLPVATAAGAAGGLLISGTNAGTTTFGALTVTGATTLTGAVSLGSTLSTTGTVTFNAFTVTNAFTVSGATTFTGAISGANASNNIVGIDVKKLSGSPIQQAGGYIGIDWALINNSTHATDLSGTVVGVTQTVTNAVSANVTQFGGTNGVFSLGRPEVNVRSTVGGNALTNSDFAVIANIASPGGSVYYVTSNGDDGDTGLAPHQSLLTLSHACTIVVAGDTIIVNGAISETTNIAVPAGVHVRGVSRETAIISTTWNDTDDDDQFAAFFANSNCVIENLTLKGTASAGKYQKFGSGNAQGGASNVLYRNVHVIGDSDGFYFTGTPNAVRIEHCIAEAKFDAMASLGSDTIDCYDSTFIVVGPTAVTPNTTVRTITGIGGRVRLYGCRIHAETTNGATTTALSAVYARSGGVPACRIELYDCSIATKVPAGYANVENSLKTDAGAVIIASGTTYDPLKVANAGTITRVSRGINWALVDNPTSTNALSGTSVLASLSGAQSVPNFTINGVPLTPTSIVDLASGLLSAGLAGTDDLVSAATLATTVNTTLTASHGGGAWNAAGGGTGTGDIAVDENYGGIDNYRILMSGTGVPVDNATIRAYVQAVYDAGTIDPEPPNTLTASDGRWVSPLMLNANTYLLTVYNPDTKMAKTFRDVVIAS
jgi:hypothetical protein